MEEGLSQSVVQKIIQDKQGFIWLATQDGLNRFDGKNFKYFKKGEPPYGLPWSNIKDIVEDEGTGLFWIATSARGACSLDPKTQTVEEISDPQKTAKSQSCNAIFLSGKNIWLATEAGISVINRLTKEIELHHNSNSVKKIVRSTANQLWAFLHDGSIQVWDANNLKLVESTNALQLFGRESLEFEKAYTYNDSIYVCTRQGLFKTHNSAPHFEEVELKTNQKEDFTKLYTYSFYIDYEGNYWIGIDKKGLLFKRKKDSVFYHFEKEKSNPYSLPDNFIIQTFQDREKNIWFATEKGLSRIHPLQQRFETVRQEQDGAKDRLSRIFALSTPDDQNIFIGRISELYLFNKQSNTITEIENHWQLDPQRIYFIHPLANNQFLVGCKNGIGIIQSKSNKYVFTKPIEYPELDTLLPFRITCLATTDNIHFLVGGIGGAGVFEWNILTHKLTHYVHNNNDAASLINDNINRILSSPKGYWIATEKGLSLFDPSKKNFTNYNFNELTKEGNPVINDLYEEGNTLWMLFYQQGLARWNTRNNGFNLYNNQEGAASNLMYNLRRDYKGDFWISTSQGLMLFDKATNHFINYSIKDGLQDNEFNRFAVFESKKKIYFGGISGFSSVDKYSSASSTLFPKITITAVRFLDDNKYIEYKNLKDEIKLQHQQNNIAIDFSSLDFTNNYRTQYSYMLEGYDKNWIENGTGNSVMYTNLDPGNYTFKIKASNLEFGGQPKITYLKVRIIPAWYQTTAFKVGVALLIALLLFLLVRWYYIARIRKQRTEFEKMLAIQQERQRISSEIHDDIGAGLSGIRLLAEITEQKVINEEVKHEVNKIHASVTELSEKMREVIWSLNTDNDKLENLLYYIQRHSQKLFENAPICLNVMLPSGQIPNIVLSGEKRRHIYLAVKEALHNCIKHANAQFCQLTMNVNEKQLFLTVKDDGRGLERNGKFIGNGLRNMEKRMNAIGGKMQIENKNGTAITFQINLNSKA